MIGNEGDIADTFIIMLRGSASMWVKKCTQQKVWIKFIFNKIIISWKVSSIISWFIYAWRACVLYAPSILARTSKFFHLRITIVRKNSVLLDSNSVFGEDSDSSISISLLVLCQCWDQVAMKCKTWTFDWCPCQGGCRSNAREKNSNTWGTGPPGIRIYALV